MADKVFSSDKARAKWREVLDTAVAGDNVIIERYGKPVAVLISYQEFLGTIDQSKQLHEETAVYEGIERQQAKNELLDELRSEWIAGWAELRRQLNQDGGLMVGMSKDEIVARLQETRQEIFEAEYAHLYR